MEISKNLEGSKLTVAVKGRLDTVTSPDLQAELDASLKGVAELAFDFSALEYISSAGLRVLLGANKTMAAASGKMTISGVNPFVREVFEMTGLSFVFTIV